MHDIFFSKTVIGDDVGGDNDIYLLHAKVFLVFSYYYMSMLFPVTYVMLMK